MGHVQIESYFLVFRDVYVHFYIILPYFLRSLSLSLYCVYNLNSLYRKSYGY